MSRPVSSIPMDSGAIVMCKKRKQIGPIPMSGMEPDISNFTRAPRRRTEATPPFWKGGEQNYSRAGLERYFSRACQIGFQGSADGAEMTNTMAKVDPSSLLHSGENCDPVNYQVMVNYGWEGQVGVPHVGLFTVPPFHGMDATPTLGYVGGKMDGHDVVNYRQFHGQEVGVCVGDITGQQEWQDGEEGWVHCQRNNREVDEWGWFVDASEEESKGRVGTIADNKYVAVRA